MPLFRQRNPTSFRMEWIQTYRIFLLKCPARPSGPETLLAGGGKSQRKTAQQKLKLMWMATRTTNHTVLRLIFPAKAKTWYLFAIIRRIRDISPSAYTRAKLISLLITRMITVGPAREDLLHSSNVASSRKNIGGGTNTKLAR